MFKSPAYEQLAALMASYVAGPKLAEVATASGLAGAATCRTTIRAMLSAAQRARNTTFCRVLNRILKEDHMLFDRLQNLEI